ncbi:MAG: hypothetical protein HUK22_05185, partial [Thermoguttaceae bacterium]|nr:hypothetical protein [Thermoguttaceae bacterium]
TTCDGSFWGDVALVADPQEARLATSVERKALRERNAADFDEFLKTNVEAIPASGRSFNQSTIFKFDDNQYAAVTLGKYGVCDGFVTIGSAEKHVQIDGVRARVDGVNVGFEPSLATIDVAAQFVAPEDLISASEEFVQKNAGSHSLCCFVSQTRGGLAFRWATTRPEKIERLEFGPFSEKAPRVYWGHGYCIVNPKAFTQAGDGFGCSTSHVAFDFSNGVSVLEATTRPVQQLVVDPERNVYTLAVSPDTQFTLRSSDAGAFDCARKYAPGSDKVASPLASKKAGRFVFDYWGGSYARVLELIKFYVAYGLTDSLYIQHCWQHYGYDVRLPDIWPPQTGQGTLEELKATQEFCDSYGIPFGLHDNYIDFYPDADGFTYDDVIINPDGQPQKAWYNPGPDVQSYRFNPTKIFPYAERNLALIKKELMQTAYFTDVFSSIEVMSFYDREGKFHTRAETVDSWK